MENKTGMPKDGELELINAYTRRELSEEEVYVFSLVLCDNEIDRDYERFSPEALKALEKLFVGVTGVLDHDPRTDNQSARIFSCKTEETGELTADGQPYIRLTARAYTPRDESTKAFITAVESGMKKEVSVGCAVSRRVCSICGGDSSRCGHIRGRQYDGKLCFATLEEPTDAYEWSFVAVPAQRAAGVVKAYNRKEGNMDIEKRIFDGTAQTFTADEMNMLADRLRNLSEKAADGEAYRERLIYDISKAAAVALPELDSATLGFLTEKLSAKRLESLCNALEKRAQQSFPAASQLRGGRTPAKQETNRNNIYKEI